MIVDNALYRKGRRVETGLPTEDLAGVRTQATAPGDFVWIGMHEPTAAELEAVQDLYGLHPLAVEDALSAHQRPKLERYDDNLFVVLKTLWYVDEDDAVETGEIAIFAGEKFVVTVRHGKGARLREARRRLESDDVILMHGPSAVVYAVCDEVVDRYEEVAASLAEDVDEVEMSVFSDERTNDAARIYVLKRELAEMRRAVLPLRDPIQRFTDGAVVGVDGEAAPYFRDVGDHLARVAGATEDLDTLLSAAFDAHIAQISIQQNDDMRKISAAVGIIAGPTLLAGVWGMNFDNQPELHWHYGYFFALGLMLLSSLAIFVWARRAGWL
ncbi:MAG TPA: magnesium/cobalt transporter CorA [Marmoricola sp.]|nr:magnesium/cobalt transporter CorA [Marmoricola sp.]